MIPTAAILAECDRRNYTQTETLAILTLALDQAWTVIDPLALNRYEAVRDGHHATHDAWYSIAASRGLPPTLWQAFKDTLYQHIREAAALYADHPGAPIEEDDLTPDEKKRLFELLESIAADAHDTRLQLRGPGDAGWGQLGKNTKGQNLSFVDAIGRIKDKLFGTNNAAS